MQSYLTKIGRIAVISTATASLLLVSTIPVFGQVETAPKKRNQFWGFSKHPL